jgi:hypothetical protein
MSSSLFRRKAGTILDEASDHSTAVDFRKTVWQASSENLRNIHFRVLLSSLEDYFGWNSKHVRELFESDELEVQTRDRIRQNWLKSHNGAIHDLPQPLPLLGQPAQL